MSLNKATLLGNIGKSPEFRKTKDGKDVATFSVATNEYTKNSNGEKIIETEWHKVAAMGKLADIARVHAKAGSRVYVEGTIKNRRWTDNKGNTHYISEIKIGAHNSRLLVLDNKTITK